MFVDILDENRKKVGAAHLNYGGRNPAYCVFCLKVDWLRQVGGKLCDFPMGNGKTCDAPICDYHATSGGKNIDYCPDHKHAAATPKEVEQSA